MSAKEAVREPQQKRSRETFRRLLSATIRVLDERGLDGASIPQIAVAAGVAPAGIYRRFADKDALFRAAFLEVLRQSNEANPTHLRTTVLRETLAATAERLVAVLFDQYRSHPHLLRALSRFIDASQDQAFVQQARSLNAENVQNVVNVVLVHKAHITHSSPEQAVRFAVLNAFSSIEAIALEPGSVWHAVFPATTEEELQRELARSFVAYLQM
jgi:AcrR family transcriptional regulator